MKLHSNRDNVKTRRDAGYSLAEMLVVLVILGLLVALVAPRVFNQIGGAQTRSAEVQANNLVTALEHYRLDVGRFPTASEGLNALQSAPSGAEGWAGPYLQGSEVPDDPWGRPYRYEVSRSGTVRVTSLGADGQPGGERENQDVVAPQ